MAPYRRSPTLEAAADGARLFRVNAQNATREGGARTGHPYVEWIGHVAIQWKMGGEGRLEIGALGGTSVMRLAGAFVRRRRVVFALGMMVVLGVLLGLVFGLLRYNAKILTHWIEPEAMNLGVQLCRRSSTQKETGHARSGILMTMDAE